ASSQRNALGFGASTCRRRTRLRSRISVQAVHPKTSRDGDHQGGRPPIGGVDETQPRNKATRAGTNAEGTREDRRAGSTPREDFSYEGGCAEGYRERSGE